MDSFKTIIDISCNLITLKSRHINQTTRRHLPEGGFPKGRWNLLNRKVKQSKVKFSSWQATKARRRMEVQLYSSFSLGARCGWVANTTPRERPGTHCIGGWVGPRAGLDGCGKSRIHRDRSTDRPVRSESLYLLSYRRPYVYNRTKHN